MDLTFLGHQSWLISENDTNILLDPVLSDKFGYDTVHGIEIYPPRTIDLKKMPKIDGIIISHEHSDHFHLPTLLAFKDVPIYIGKLMPSCVTDVLQQAQLTVYELDFKHPFCINDIELTLYRRGNGTAFWESRVTQVLVQSLVHVNASVFIAVDALVSTKFKEDILQEIISLPTAIIVANNSQIPPKGVPGSLDNSSSFSLSKSKGIVGLKILSSMLIHYLEGIEDITDIIICGGGFMKSYDTFFGPFQFSDQNELAVIAQELCPGKNIYGPLPGEVIKIENDTKSSHRADFVNLDECRLNDLNDIRKHFKANPKLIPLKSLLGDFKDKFELELAREKVEEELKSLAKAIMLSSFGERIINTHEAGPEPSSENRLIIRFLLNDGSQSFNYCLDFNSASFKPTDIGNYSSIPFGIELYLKDFCALIEGKIQIWDLAGIAMRSWYVGAPLESPIGFLYTWYGEQVHTDNNFQCYMNRWQNVLGSIGASEVIG